MITTTIDLKHQSMTNNVSYYAAVLNLQNNNWFWIANYASMADIKQTLGRKLNLAINEVNEQFKVFEMGDRQKINKARIAQKYRGFFDNPPTGPFIKTKKQRANVDPTTRNRIVRLSDADHAKLLKLGGSSWVRLILSKVEV